MLFHVEICLLSTNENWRSNVNSLIKLFGIITAWFADKNCPNGDVWHILRLGSVTSDFVSNKLECAYVSKNGRNDQIKFCGIYLRGSDKSLVSIHHEIMCTSLSHRGNKTGIERQVLADAEASHGNPGPLFTKRQDVLPPNLVKSRSHEIGCFNGRIALKFVRHLGSSAAEVPAKFQSDWKSLNPNLAASRLHEILR